jgi:hypothetical protein
MLKHGTVRGAGWGALLLCGVAVSAPAAGADEACLAPAAPRTLEGLTRLSWLELEALYRGAEAGAVPTGYAHGRAVYCPDRRLAGVRSALTRALWHGKIFNCAGDGLVNQWSGLRAIRAEVYYGPSWLDGRPAIVMDYCRTSRVWANVRDEVREVAPGLYLGRMYRRKPCGPEFQMFFALQICPDAR